MKAEWTNKDVLTQSETTGQSKAVLVLEEMPKYCFECPLSVDGWCYGTNDCGISESWEERPKWCPLKEMPKRIENVDDQTIFDYEDAGAEVKGWNRCIEEIEKC